MIPRKAGSVSLAVPAAYRTMPMLSPDIRVGPEGVKGWSKHSMVLRLAHASAALEDSPTGKQ
eukprot:7595021-Lingulodinium_polyedra.AAC.1